ncbi:MAG: hypothetical protein ACKV2U_05820 [Bryobacteraceae bacterium]
MQRLDIFLKVELELDNSEQPQRIARELERILRKHYGVRTAEATNLVVRED